MREVENMQGNTDDITVPEFCGEPFRDFWIERNGCTTTTLGCVAYQGCKSGTAVSLLHP